MKKQNSIFYGAIMLTGANLLLRVVSMGFQVFLSARIGAAGIGLLQLIFSVAGLSFTMGAAGVRICAMYLSAEELGRGRPQGIGAVLAGCARYSLLFSGSVALVLWIFAPKLAEFWIGNPAASASLRTYAVFLPLACQYGVLSGYYTAAGRIRDLVLVEFLEQGCSMAATVFFLIFWAGRGPGGACQAVVMGGCISSALSFLCLLLLRDRGLPPQDTRLRPPYRRIYSTALPLGLADTLRSGLNAIENLIVPKRLALFAGTVDALADYGIVCGMVFPLLMFPAAILFSLSELLVPELSRCAAGKRKRRIRYLVRRSLRVAFLFGLFSGGLLFSGAEALGMLLYKTSAVGDFLRRYALLVPMLYTDNVVDAMCKGLGQQKANVRYNTITSFLDVTFLWLLLPRYGLSGYFISFVLTHAINFFLSLRRLILVSGIRPKLMKPVSAMLCALGSGAMVLLLPKWSGILGILLPGLCYMLLLLLSWSLLHVTGQQDLLWLRGLVDKRKRPAYNGEKQKREA